jgi:hypothetical protein
MMLLRPFTNLTLINTLVTSFIDSVLWLDSEFADLILFAR